jgi:LPS O-antigen subunit length determinant protein (WzzB/FepE family)
MMQPYPNQPYIEEDEIDLRELFATIWGNKFKIISLSILITSLALIYALTKPNSYASQTILILKEQSKPNLGGGAAALAAMAGINLGGSSASIDVGALFKNLINDYAFNKEVITRYHLASKLSPEAMDKNMVYVLNGREMRADIAKFFSFEKEEKNKEEIIYDTFKDIKKIISTSTDKESGAITLSATLEDRFLAKELVHIYLKEMSDYIKRLDLKEIDEQVAYYENELASTTSLDLKQNITELLSALVKKKVLSQAGEFYMVKQLTKPEVAYIKDKTKPKRGLLIVVAFITSIILGIFMVFFGEFLKNSKERKSELSF